MRSKRHPPADNYLPRRNSRPARSASHFQSRGTTNPQRAARPRLSPGPFDSKSAGCGHRTRASNRSSCGTHNARPRRIARHSFRRKSSLSNHAPPLQFPRAANRIERAGPQPSRSGREPALAPDRRAPASQSALRPVRVRARGFRPHWAQRCKGSVPRTTPKAKVSDDAEGWVFFYAAYKGCGSYENYFSKRAGSSLVATVVQDAF